MLAARSTPALQSRRRGAGSLCLALTGLLLAAAPAALAETPVAGVMAGALSVDETGSAGYSVPIAVPPGIAGLQPAVALTYQSHGGNGTAGVGWSLSASSAIHRCPQTLAQDGAIHGVDFSADDRFCLDGQRLVAVSGTYGADGTEYRTEIESFARIISHGAAGSGPLFFTVETKAGRTMDYGGTPDARLGVPGKDEIRLWSLDKISDPLGNAMTYHYVEDTTDKSYRLNHIAYTRNDAQSVLPQSEVRFLYEARPDARTSWQAGAELAMTRRLTNVQTFTDTGSGPALVRDYRLAYETSPATGRSRLTAVTECDASGNCLAPVSLGWQGEVSGYSKEIVNSSWEMSLNDWSVERRKFHILDYNGDGLSDILLQGKDSTNWSYLLTSNGAGFNKAVIASDTGTNLWGMSSREWAAGRRALHVLDYNGDGLSDILLQGVNSESWSYLLTNDGPAPDLVTAITDSLGRVSTIDYAPLTDGAVYAKDADAVFPVVDIQAPLYVVKLVSADDGLGGQKVTSYTYAGAKVHVQGRGFRGFRRMTATDQQTGIVTTTDYSQAFPTTAQVVGSLKELSDGTTLKTLANTWEELSLNGGATVWPYVANSVSEDYEPGDGPGNLPVVSRTATAAFDGFGNPLSLTTTTEGGGGSFTETTVNTYTNDTTNWHLGLLTRSETTRTRSAGP